MAEDLCEHLENFDLVLERWLYLIIRWFFSNWILTLDLDDLPFQV